METIGERIKKSREKAKLNQKQLGEILGRSQATITDIENNKNKGNFDILIKICETLNVSADWILFGTAGQPEESDLNEEGCRLLEEYKEYLKERYPAEEREYTKAGNL